MRSPALALVGLALVGLLQAGCQSDGCSTCGGFVSRLSNKVQALGSRVTKHFDGCKGGESCGCGDEGGMIDSGMPMAPGGMIVPAPGTILPAPSMDSAPIELSPLDSTSKSGTNVSPLGSSPTSTRSVPGGANKSAYTTMAPRNNSGTARKSEVSRALLSSSDGVNRSSNSQEVADLLENIPPVDLHSDVTNKATNGTGTTPPVATNPAASPAEKPAPTPAEKVSAAGGAADLLPVPPISVAQAPGIRRYGPVAPSIAGGSAPSVEGLDWLKEKGYRTFVDLRRGSEIDPNFVDAVNDRNMFYLSLPILATRLDASRLARFDELIAQSGNRPLYFCDTDGSRAALAWYIHLRVVDGEDKEGASSKAEEIGLTDIEVGIAERYLAEHKPLARAEVTRVALSTKLDRVEEAIDLKDNVEAPVSSSAAGTSKPVEPIAPPVSPNDPSPAMLPGEDRPQASRPPVPYPSRYRDMASWRPVAALLLTGIGVPLACWSKNAFCESRTVKRRASLPAAAPRSIESRPSSDV